MNTATTGMGFIVFKTKQKKEKEEDVYHQFALRTLLLLLFCVIFGMRMGLRALLQLFCLHL